MNMILIKPEEFSSDDGIVKLNGRRYEHIRKVIKPSIGDSLKTGILNGAKGESKIIDMDETSVSLQFKESESAPEPARLTLILALFRPKAFRRAIFNASMMGIKEIHVINTWRVEKSFWQSPYLAKEKIDEQLILSLEQSCDTIMPEVHFHRFFMDFIDNTIDTISSNKRRIIAHPAGKTFNKENYSDIIAAIGPEGGFIQKEIDSFKSKGFEITRFTDRVLTTENAIPFISGALLS